MIRILHVFSTLNAGGMENYVMNLYRKIDRQQIQFDFLVHHQARGLFEDEIENMGGIIYHFSVLDDRNILRYCRQLDLFFKEHTEYRIVHGHLSSLAVFYFGYAKKYSVPWRIAHSHGAGFLHTPKGFAKYLLFRSAKWKANIRLACSTEAGKYLYGKSSFTVVPNGVDSNRFAFKSDVREEMRHKLGLDDCFVIGHVGRFNLQKNHSYLLRIFSAFQEDAPNARLLLLGNGELWDMVHEQAQELGINDKVYFLGVHKDSERYYQAMDAFVLPSLFEGLPVTGIEAQYAGLPCFFSDTISKEVAISDNVRFLGIKESNISQWCCELKTIIGNERKISTELKTDDFDINTAVKKMVQMYTDLWEKKPC